MRITIIPLLFSTLVGCTVAVPEITSLSQVLSFSGKSLSPFDQDHLGNAIFFSGYCLPDVTGFEYRLNDHALWTDIPATSPTPGSGEYLVGTHPYDVDCSDGEYDFYIFQSSIMGNFGLNGVTQTASDPTSVELRTKGNLTLPTIRYTRPSPSSFQFYFYDYNFRGYTEVNRSQRFSIRLVDAIGKHAMVPSGSSIEINFTLTDINGTSLPAGEIYDATCTSAITNAQKTYNPGDEELDFCYIADGVAANTTINIQASYAGMFSHSAYIMTRPENSVISYLSANGSGRIPPVILKGVDYSLSMGISPLYSNNNTRYITNYQGSLQVSTTGSAVNFSRTAIDTECPSGSHNPSLTCPTNSTYKSFLINIDPSYSNNFLNLTVTALPQAACGSNCTIYGDSLVHQIGQNDYIASTFSIPVVDGPTTFDQPYMNISNDDGAQIIRLDQCISADVAFANLNDNPFPATENKTFSMTEQSGAGLVEFFYSPDCTGTSAGTSYDLMLFTGELFRSTYFRVSSSQTLPASGIINITLTDTTTTLLYVKSFYIKTNN